MEASTITPIAIAIPPKLIIFAEIPNICIIMKLIRIPTGKEKIATKAERKCSRKIIETNATANICNKSVLFSVLMER